MTSSSEQPSTIDERSTMASTNRQLWTAREKGEESETETETQEDKETMVETQDTM